MNKVKDLTGQKFGKLTVLERAPDKYYPCGTKEYRWKCQCDCGNITIVATNHLKRKKHPTQSCGCIVKKNAIKQLNKIHNGEYASHKEYNKYDLSGEYGIGYTKYPNKEGINYFYFDLEDYNKIKNYCWHFARGYIEAWDYLNKDKNTNIRIHRLIMNCPSDKEVDHINHKTYDNRKSQLRIVTSTQNSMNQKPSKMSSTGVRGISYSKTENRYIVRIGINNKRIYLGSYKTLEEAKQVRKKAEKEYYGEYRYKQNTKETI